MTKKLRTIIEGDVIKFPVKKVPTSQKVPISSIFTQKRKDPEPVVETDYDHKIVRVGSSFSIPLSPQHQWTIKNLKHQETKTIKTDGMHWNVTRNDKKIHFRSGDPISISDSHDHVVDDHHFN